MNPFFTTNIPNWLPLMYVFSNIRTFHDNHAYMDNYDPQHHHLSMCLDNCTQFPSPQSCIDYCHSVQNTLDRSNTVDPFYQCKDGRCCKQKAGTNDYAYVRCVEQLGQKKTFSMNDPWTLVFFILLLFILVLIKCT